MAKYSIKDIEKVSGIKAHTIRMWERRHGLVIPKRTDTNIRYYSDEDLRDILNISILNQNGMKISKIAKLEKDELREEVVNLLDNSQNYAHVLDAMLISMIDMNEQDFNKSFSDNLEEYGFEKLIENIIFPLLERIGLLWQTDIIKPAHEHFVSNLLRQKIITTIHEEILPENIVKDKIIFFLPESEQHELGLLYYSYIARKKGYDVIYLGASVPLRDLKQVRRITDAKAFVSSYIAAIDREELENMFCYLSETFPNTPFYVTGLQIKEIDPTLPKGFESFSSAEDFKKCLLNYEKQNK